MKLRIASLACSLLLIQALPAWAVCKDYGNFKAITSPDGTSQDGGTIVGGVRFGDYKQDKIEAYFYGQACWTASEIAEEGNQRIFYKLIASHDADGRIASYVSTDESAPGLFPCPPGTVQSTAEATIFDAVDGAKPGLRALVCRAQP